MEGFSKNNDKGFSIMVKMGYKPGAGLGKDEAGMLQPINASVKNDKRGFGHDSFKENQSHEVWDGKDKINIEEELIWIHSNDSNATHQFSNLTLDDFLNFIVKKEPLTTLENEIHFCDPATLRSVLKTKEDVFLTLDAVDLSKARQRANQFETIKSAFFMNRAALKMANIDAATGFMFTNIDKDINHKKKVGPYYFADVCAGPGGFSEYILWRKKWSFKGFGLTLKGVHDFKVCNSTCASDVTFRGYYGSANDGNACNPCNISDFTNKILHETDKIGVHFMMSDGGFSVEGNEGIQEILSKQIYICQCLIALEIVRKHGHFVTKLFDIFTTFSVGLMFLMYQCFEKVAVLKPNSSRPANSERYFICSNLKDSPIVMEVRNYLRKIVNDLWNMRKVRKETDVDIVEIIPLELIKGDSTFYNYIRSQNTKIAEVQTESLRKLALFCKNPNLIDEKQVQLRSKCLEYWHIPNLPRAPAKKFTTDDLLNIAIQKPEYLYVQSRIIKNLKELQEQVVDVHDWIYVPLASSMMSNNCHIFAGVGAMSAYKLQNRKWVNVKGLKLVKGTLLFGEIVTEISSQAETTEKLEVKTLHVIDALRLGDISLADLDFQERSVLIQTYCKSINFETAGDQFRIRPKLSDKLINIHANSLIHYAFIANALYTHLPTLGYGAFREHFIVNSILLLKTGENHFFNTTYVLRTQVFLEKSNDEEKTEDSLQYDAVLQYVKDKL